MVIMSDPETASPRAVKFNFSIRLTEAIHDLDGEQPYSAYDQFMEIRMEVGTKYAVLYVVSTQLFRIVYCVSNLMMIDPAQECSQVLSWPVIFLFLTMATQPLLYFKRWYNKFKQFNDRAKVCTELALVFKLCLIHFVIRIGLRIVLQFLVGMEPRFMTRISEYLMVTILNILLFITIYLPLRWQKKFDKERQNIRGLPLQDFLRNAWYRKEFGKFLKDDVVILSFYESITEFLQTMGSMTRAERRYQVNKIFNPYIADTAPFSTKLKSTTHYIREIQKK
eukprot:972035_1